MIHLLQDTILDCMADDSLRTVTFISDERNIIRVTKVLYNGKPLRKGSNVTLVVTIGRPNYAERKFIKKNKKLGFPQWRGTFIKE